MLFEPRLRDGIAAGAITVALRRWKRAQVVAGGRYRTGLDIIEMDAVDVINEDQITDADVRDAGYDERAALINDLRGDQSLPLFRLRFHRIDEPDPRAVLAADEVLTGADVDDIKRRLERLDRASSHGAWTIAVLTLIADRPGVRAADLAASMRRETQPFKVDVRKLKNLGLTISLEKGYEVSRRGRAYLNSLGRPGSPSA